MNKIITIFIGIMIIVGVVGGLYFLANMNKTETVNQPNNSNVVDNNTINNPPPNPETNITINAEWTDEGISIIYNDTSKETDNITITISNGSNILYSKNKVGYTHEILVPMHKKDVWVIIVSYYKGSSDTWRFELNE